MLRAQVRAEIRRRNHDMDRDPPRPSPGPQGAGALGAATATGLVPSVKPSGTYDVRALFHTDETDEHLSGSYTVDVVDTKGNKVLTDGGRLHGGRVQVERT
jgi:hypothetical protein